MSEPRVACPWHADAWQELCARASTRLPHALLLTGERGVGKRRFADAFAAWLLCAAPGTDMACGRCKSCLLVDAGTHPDLLVVTPEEEGKAIRVEQVRDLIGFATHTAQFGGRRAIVVDPAQAMNANAANALLKTLEEPGPGTVLLLVSDAPAALPATIRSRCQVIGLPSPTPAQAVAWLAPLAGGEAKARTLLAAGMNPLRALALLGDGAGWLEARRRIAAGLVDVLRGDASPVPLAEALRAAPEALLLDWLPGFVADAARLAMGGGEDALRNPDLLPDLRRLVDARPTQPLFLLADDLQLLRRQFLSAPGLNRALLWEELLLRWSARPNHGRQRQ